MKVIYDSETDTLVVILAETEEVAESDEGKPGSFWTMTPLETWCLWRF